MAFLMKNILRTISVKDFNIPGVMWIVVLLFFVKSLLLSFWITPLWEVPDESAHLAYIIHVSQGKGIPVLGEAIIQQEIIENWYTKTEPPTNINWIAQHPPAYYVFGAIFYKIGAIFICNIELLFKVPRLLTSLSAALALLVFYRILLEVAGCKTFSIITVTSISFIPMYSHMSSGVNHDAFLTLLSALAILYWIKYLKYCSFKDALIMAIWLSIAGATKITALAFAGPMVAITFFYVKGPTYPNRLYKWIFIGAISGLLPGLWMIRNWILFNNPLMDITQFDKMNSTEILNVGIVEYLKSNEVIHHTFINFFGMFGWTGIGEGQVVLYQISGIYLKIFSISLLAIVFLSTIWYFNYLNRIRLGNTLRFCILVSIILAVVLIYFSVFVNKIYPIENRLLYTLLIGSILFSLTLPLNGQGSKHTNIIFYSCFIILMFLIAYIYSIKGLYEIYHVMRATHGRYWFPLIPFLVIAYIYPFYREFSPSKWIQMSIILLFSSLELLFYVTTVIPFYQGVF